MAYLTLIITIPLTVFCLLFAISNDKELTVALWPLDQTWTMQIWLFGLCMLGGGFFLGALFVWLLAQKTRFLYWKEARRAHRLEKDLDALNAKAPPSADLAKEAPALPAK